MSLKSKSVANLFASAAKDSFNAYLDFGARDPRKVLPLHSSIKESFAVYELNARLEYHFNGKFYTKRCDVAVEPSMDGLAKGVVLAKYPLTSYKKNSTNYFEGLLGETLNIQQAGALCGHFIFLPAQSPNLDRDGVVRGINFITDSDIDRYRKLAQSAGPVSPILYIQVVDPWSGRLRIGKRPPKRKATDVPFVADFAPQSLSIQNRRFLKSASNVDKFLQSFL